MITLIVFRKMLWKNHWRKHIAMFTQVVFGWPDDAYYLFSSFNSFPFAGGAHGQPLAALAASFCRGWPQSLRQAISPFYSPKGLVSESRADIRIGRLWQTVGERGAWLATSTTDCWAPGAGKEGEPVAWTRLHCYTSSPLFQLNYKDCEKVVKKHHIDGPRFLVSAGC